MDARRRLPIQLLALVALLAAPAGAHGATVSVEGDSFASRVHYRANPGEANALTITGTDDALMLVDVGASLTPGPGCTGGGVPGTPVVCARQGEHFAPLNAELGDLDDSIDTQALALASPLFFIRVDAGNGADTVLGGVGIDVVTPGRGADEVETGAGDDRWDQQSARPDGPDRFDGGAGVDTALYLGSDRIRAALDGRANDGGRDEHDNLLDIENVTAVRGGVLVGNRRDNELLAGEGNDRVLGGRGDDFLEGRSGRDVLHGGRGDDTINSKRHTLGQPSGRDKVDCGSGDDVAIVNRDDRVRNCETVHRYPS